MLKNFIFNDFMSESDEKVYEKLESIINAQEKRMIYITGDSNKRKSKFVDLYVYHLNKLYGDKVLFITEKGKILEHIWNILPKSHQELVGKDKDFGEVLKKVSENFVLREKKENMTLRDLFYTIRDNVNEHDINTVVIDSLSVQDFNFDYRLENFPEYTNKQKSFAIQSNLCRFSKMLNVKIILLKDNIFMDSDLKSNETIDLGENESTVTIKENNIECGNKLKYVLLDFK